MTFYFLISKNGDMNSINIILSLCRFMVLTSWSRVPGRGYPQPVLAIVRLPYSGPVSTDHIGHLMTTVFFFFSFFKLKIKNFKTLKCRVFLVAQMVKNLPAVHETQVQSLGQEDPLEKGMTLCVCVCVYFQWLFIYNDFIYIYSFSDFFFFFWLHGMRDLSSLTRDQILARWSGSSES